MSDLFSIGVSGLVSFQRALGTAGNNIVNANTEGYSRQESMLVTTPSNYSGGSYFGTGVAVERNRRIVDEFYLGTVRTNISANAQYEALYDQASQIDEILADPATGMANALESFFAAVEGVANDPASIPARQVMLTQGEILAGRFQRIDNQLQTMSYNVDEKLGQLTADITAFAQGIAEINRNIVQSGGNTDGGVPNELLDQRDLLLEGLAAITNVIPIPVGDGTTNVLIGSGESLVINTTYNNVTINDDITDNSVQTVVVEIGPIQQQVNMPRFGGEVQGLYEFRENVLKPARNAMGLLAIGIAEIMNSQHSLGMDLNGNLGGNFFNDMTAGNGIPNQSNLGNGAIATTITDVNSLTGSDYYVTYDGNYNVTRLSDNAFIGAFPPGTNAVASEGFTFTTTGTSILGDNFIISPTRTKAQDIRVNVSDSKQIAAAVPIRTSTDSSNIGTGAISAGTVSDVSGAEFTTTAGALTPPVVIIFTTTTDYEIHNNTTPPITLPSAGTLLATATYTPNQVNNMIPAGLGYGYQVEVSGAPEAGDRFEVTYNTGGVSDNRNALLLSQFQDQAVLNTNTTTFRQSYGQLVADIGNKTREAKISVEATSSLLEQSLERKDSISGVNLDEEGAELLRFQNAYQAAARIISVASTLLDELISATR